MINEVVIEYGMPIEYWKKAFIDGLEEHGVIYDDKMITNICASLSATINVYLSSMGYRPKSTLQYRKGLSARLWEAGLKLEISTNRVMWKYLEYFTDVEDYSPCFNIEIKICDYEKATKDMIFVGVNTDHKTGIVKHPKYSEEYASLTRKVDLLRLMAERSTEPEIMKDLATQIVDVLDILIRRLD